MIVVANCLIDFYTGKHNSALTIPLMAVCITRVTIDKCSFSFNDLGNVQEFENDGKNSKNKTKEPSRGIYQ